MAVYFITGKLGSGKTLCAVGRIKQYLQAGRHVATNLDLKLDKLLPESSKQTVSRLPDKPRLQDMQALGSGCVEEDENYYGLIVLDELGTWFNSRNWRDKERGELIDWFIHARKYHWDIIFIVQSIESIDGQLINSLCEHLVVCKRTDRLNIPIIGGLISFLGFSKTMPKVHVASVYYGSTVSDSRVDRWIYRGKDLYEAYSTSQVFKDEYEYIGDVQKDTRATRTLLSSHHLNHVQYRENLKQQLIEVSPNEKGGVASLPDIDIRLISVVIFLVVIYLLFGRTTEAEQIKVTQVDGVIPAEVKQQKKNNIIHAVYKPSEETRTAKSTFIDKLFESYRPRLAAYAQSPTFQTGIINLYDNVHLVESFTIDQLHSLGVAVVRKSYGVDLITDSNTYVVTSWSLAVPAKKTEKKETTVF